MIKYGELKHDFGLITTVLESTKTKVVFEIGAGSGRLMPVYLQNKYIHEIYLQDISSKSLSLIKLKDNRVKLISSEFLKIDLERLKIDLLISNRVLQHVIPELISEYIEKICKHSKIVYVNELTKYELQNTNEYMFLHDYEFYFLDNNFYLKERGIINKQVYYIFVKA